MTIVNQLLFFDTFSHEAADIIQLDLVQFPRPVQVNEIRVIPLGARVKADFPGGVRLGATNPSSFEIEFFINDLSKRGAATFENVGKLQYSQHGNIQLEFEKKSPTDGLLLRGNYNTITLAVYGNLTNVQREPTPPKSDRVNIPQPPPEKVNTHERIRHWLEDTKRKQHVYEINPSEEGPSEWEAKNRRSPGDLESAKVWDGQPDSAPHDTDKEKKSFVRSQSREKSWDRADRASRKDAKKDRPYERNSSRESRDLSLEKEKQMRTHSRDRFEEDDSLSRGAGRRSIIDEWEEKTEDVSSLPLRRPRTPLEPTGPPSDSHPSSYAKEEDRTADLSRGSNPLPPPILSDDMEAISDDEDLPDLPPPEDFREVHMEDDETEPTPTEEVADDNEIFEYEQIMSDEDDLPEYQYEEDYIIEEWEDWVKPFIAQDQQELPTLGFYTTPTSSEYERELQQFKSLGVNVDNYEDKQALGVKLWSVVTETSLPGTGERNSPEGEDKQEESGEVWVQAVEQVCQLLPSALVYAQDSQDILQKLTEWVEYGLDLNMALNQQQPVFKIRHMKAGIRLLSVLVLIRQNLSTRDIFEKLFILDRQPHLAGSIKLQIIKTFDVITSTSIGLRNFVHKKSEDQKTAYETILEMLSVPQPSRAKMALSALIRKIHLLEVCEKFNSDCLSLINILGETDDARKQASYEEKMDVDMKDLSKDDVCAEFPFWASVSPDLLNSMDSCLKDIHRLFVSAEQLLVHSNRRLPGFKQFQLAKDKQNSLLCILNIFEISKLIESLTLLVANPCVGQNASLCRSTKTLLQTILSSEQGIRFLAWQPKATMMLIKALLQFSDEAREYQSDQLSFYQLGGLLCSIMHVVHQLDSLAVLQRSSENSLEEEVCHLHSVESLLVSPMGREAVIGVLSVPPFLDPLLSHLRSDDVDPLTTACFGYAVDLLSLVVKHQDSAAFLDCYADKIHAIMPSEVAPDSLRLEETTKLIDLQPWVSVAKDPDVFSYDKLAQLATVVQENLERLEKFPGEMFTALRLLSHLAIPKAASEEDNEVVDELKYKYAVIQLFSADLHTHIINMLTKLFGMYQQPFLHSSNFSGPEGGLVVLLLKPSLALLKTILDQIIQVRNADFKDLTAVIPLVQTYILLQAFPASSQYYGVVHDLQQTVVNTLLSYTQVVYTTEGEEVLSKSLWTQMMTEIFKYLMNSPHTMVYVITLITELLPLPLPIESLQPLSEEERAHVVRVRKLWSAHLYSLAPIFQETTHRLGLSTQPILSHSLRRMCVALSDLSAPMALLVAKATLDLVLQTHRLDQRALPKDDDRGLQASQQTARALNMLASLVSHAPTKTAVLHLLRGGSPTLSQTAAKTEEKYAALVHTWCAILGVPMKAAAHMAAQECLVTVIESLMDPENTMHLSSEEKSVVTGVPPKEIILPFVETMVDVVRSPSSQPPIIFHCLRVLATLTDHTWGFYYVKTVLDSKKGSLHQLLQTVSLNLRQDESGEIVALLQEALSFFQCLVCCNDDRPACASVSELASYVSWKLDPVVEASKATSSGEDVEIEEVAIMKEDEKMHPLKILERLVVSEVAEEEMMECLYEEISGLISLLEKEASAAVEPTELEEPSAVGLEPIQSLFANRIVDTFPAPEEELQSLWLSVSPFEEVHPRDVVNVNLMETCRKYAPDFDLVATLNKLVKGQGSHSASPQKLTKVVPKYKQSATAIRPDKRGKPYVAPMRGRSFGRAMNIRSDPFRSRPPNTSRPPSLHVDDFVALESTGHQPTGPTGYNKISFGRGKIMLDSMRGSSRGRTRGENRGGRFFHRPPFRGEGNRGPGRGSGSRRGSGWVFRGEGSQRGSFRGNSQLPPRFIRGRPFSRGSGGGGPKDRFSQKFERVSRGDRGRHIRGNFR